MVEVSTLVETFGDMDFAHRLVALRKQKGLTQQALADRVGLHVSQVRRYEAGDSQPNLDALRNLAIALSVSTDALVFDEAERGPDDDLRLAFEATSRLDADERTMVKQLIEAVLLKHEAKRWAS
jgi:transcriptional regulator with XRE-family HTH domain